MDINYIYKNVLMLSNGEKMKIRKKELSQYIDLKKMVMVAPNTFVNTDNIKEIDYVNSIIVFENGDSLDKLRKKIFI